MIKFKKSVAPPQQAQLKNDNRFNKINEAAIAKRKSPKVNVETDDQLKRETDEPKH